MKKLLWTPVFAIILVVFATGFIIYSNDVLAENTYSIDFESSSSQYLSITDANQTGLDITGDLTIEAWIKFESQAGTNDGMVIASKWNNNSSQRSWILAQRDVSGTKYLRFVTSNDGSSVSAGDVAWSPSNDVWYHIAAVYNSSAGEIEYYVDGSSIGTASGIDTSLYNSSADFSIGTATYTSPSEFFDGKIDDVRIWNQMRTSTEISDDKDRELYGNEIGLVGYWKLNNGLSDETSNGNNLTNNNSTLYSSFTAFVMFTESLKSYKSSNESVVNSTILQNDNDLVLSLSANKIYSIDGILFATSTSATPDIKISFYGQTGSDIAVGYTNDRDEMVLFSGDESNTIGLIANIPQSIHIKGTVKTGSEAGYLQLKWAQSTSNSNATTIMKGSYLKAEEL